MTQRLRIVEIIPTLAVGGIQHLIAQLSSELVRRGHAVKLVAFYRGGPIEQQYRHLDLEVWHIKPYRLNMLANRVAGELKSFQADILHAHPGAGARLGAFRAHVPVVSTYHTIGNIRSWIPKVWERYLARRTNALVAISGAVRDYWAQRLATDRFEVVHNGIDLTAFCDLPDRLEATKRLGWSGRQVLYIGRLYWQKAIDVLLKAWAKIDDRRDWQLKIAGSGEEESVLRKLAGDLGINGSTTFVGETLEPYLMMRAADVVVVPSRIAAFELVVVEAMAASTPVIVSDAGALPEVAGDAALTFRNEDIDDLAAKLNQIMNSDALALVKVEKGLQRAANFSLDRMVDGYEQLFHKIAGK
jgi:glycosyltransferase involved in cell wall biosynthesis